MTHSSETGSWWKAAPAPPLPRGEVHLWRVDLSAPFSEDSLSEEERVRAASYGAPAARRRFAATRAALRLRLGQYAQLPPAALPLAEGPHRKPFLNHPAAIEFNASHSGDTALLAFARSMPVGVDVESIDRPRVDAAGIAGRFFSPAEASCWKASGGHAASFFRIWTRKEAVLKAEGSGWTAGGATFSVAAFWPGSRAGEEAYFWPPAVQWEKGRFALFDIDLGSGFSAALAVARQTPERICYFKSP